MNTAPIPVTIAIDVEPDMRMIPRHASGDWKGFERIAEFLHSRRQSLVGVDGKPATFTWLLRMDPQIRLGYGDHAYGVRRYRKLIDELAAAGDDFGLHTHLYDWDLREQRWVTEFGRPDWASACVAEAIGAYRDEFGTEPRTHSFGDRYDSLRMLDELEAGGIRCEMTTESGLCGVDGVFPNELHRGPVADSRHAPRHVWRPARDEPLRHDPRSDRSILMVPVSTYRLPAHFRVGRWVDMRRRQLRGKPGSMDERKQRYARLCLEHRPYVFRSGLRQLEREFSPGHLHLVMNSSQALDEAQMQRYRGNLDYLNDGPDGRRYGFAGATWAVGAAA